MTAQQVEILDRSEMTDQLKEMIALDPKETTIVTIDMHRGHLDPEVATMPASDEDCESVIGHAEELLGFARSHQNSRRPCEARLQEDSQASEARA